MAVRTRRGEGCGKLLPMDDLECQNFIQIYREKITETIDFFPVVLGKKIITNSYFHFFFNVYMSKCRQFEGLSTGIFTWTIPNHTIKLQLHRPRHLIFEQ